MIRRPPDLRPRAPRADRATGHGPRPARRGRRPGPAGGSRAGACPGAAGQPGRGARDARPVDGGAAAVSAVAGGGAAPGPVAAHQRAVRGDLPRAGRLRRAAPGSRAQPGLLLRHRARAVVGRLRPPRRGGPGLAQRDRGRPDLLRSSRSSPAPSSGWSRCWWTTAAGCASRRSRPRSIPSCSTASRATTTCSAYIQSPAGKRFLESAPISLDADAPAAQHRGAVWPHLLVGAGRGGAAAQRASGLQFVGQRQQWEEIGQPLSSMGILVVAIGLGFLISAAASYFLSRRLGLLPDYNAKRDVPAPHDSL